MSRTLSCLFRVVVAEKRFEVIDDDRYLERLTVFRIAIADADHQRRTVVQKIIFACVRVFELIVFAELLYLECFYR